MLVFIQKGQTNLNCFKIFRENAETLTHGFNFVVVVVVNVKIVSAQKAP